MSREELEKMPEVYEMFQLPEERNKKRSNVATVKGKLDVICEEILAKDNEIDPYYLYIELTDRFISVFPKMKDAWNDLNEAQRTIFIEGLYYGCHHLATNHRLNP